MLAMNPMTDHERTVPFGFREVAEDEKPRLVGKIFTNVARRYDVMNDLMSLGVHRVWKQALIDWLAPSPDTQLLDVAGGTGDIAFRFLDRLSARKGTARATVCDINPEMLAVGRARAAAVWIASLSAPPNASLAWAISASALTISGGRTMPR